MSELDKLKALLDVPPPLPAPTKPKAAPEALLSPQRRRRRWLGLLLVILALDAVYLLAKALIFAPQ